MWGAGKGDSQSHQRSRLRTSKHVADGGRRGWQEGKKKKNAGHKRIEETERKQKKRRGGEKRGGSARFQYDTDKQAVKEGGESFLWSTW